ncbi:hypothetical protein SUGI_1215540 [Cryptomeria japonica]|uniref:TIR domain-containing protein n=1 Tax=Cryptomeria japonica TaxID=3369 RepID=A0AAD3NMG9_CRYJA|nr:hypothetical protein SUGI_1215540 [Cryptomeria japonica]
MYNPPTTKLVFQSDKSSHVFLSFRGPDVRKTLVDHLYQALSAAGLVVFLDSEKLEKGEIIGLSLEKAIESSVIRIPIFSQGYADSAWCLKEAAAMLRTPGLIIPLFYHVDPTHVRYPENESSPYKESFLKHYGRSDRYPRGEIDGWKKAILQICSRSGWSMDITQGYEARLVKTLVNDIIRTLDRVPLQVAKYLVELDNVKNVFIQKLNLNSVDDVVKIGIWGIGGIGKTTVAKAVYNQIYSDFEAASFVFNVRTNAADSIGLTNVQKQLLEELTRYDGKVHSVDKGISLFRDRLRGKRLLLILDDVDTIVQLNSLVGDWLVPGSRIIITSRDKHILNVVGIPSSCIHEMIGLEINEGLQLFSWHAFLRTSPSPSYEDLTKRIVKAYQGHPLSLEVIGSYLYNKQDNIGCWTDALRNIILNPEIHERLYISYSALSDDEKEMFVDIACFFIGENKRFPIVLWKSLYKMVDSAVCYLSMKLLIKIEDRGIFDMHDHLQDMGRLIAEKEKRGTRLWEKEGTRLEKAAHSSTISNINFSRLRLNGGNLQRLKMMCRPGLCYLHLQNMPIDVLTEDTMAMLPKSLIWLKLEDCTFAVGKNRALKEILIAIRKIDRALRKLRHYIIAGNIRQLKIMQLNDCHFFDTLSVSSIFSLLNIQLLQHLYLKGCEGLNNFPDTIGNLSQLHHLEWYYCEGLNNLPHTIGNLSQLRSLYLEGCDRLHNLPRTIGNLSQLQQLNLRWCDRLNYLPGTIGNLSQLQHLDLGRCESLNNIPCTIGNLSQLKHLNLIGCKSLNNLPYAIGNLLELQLLDLGRCESLNNLPDSIGNLSQLQCLYLEGCDRLKNLPNAIGNLSQL